MTLIPKNHPRYLSLKIREQISQGLKNGLVHETGLIAHGRGEAFDYLIGETTIPFADQAIQATAASLLLAKKPVISINGNVAALSAKDCVILAEAIPAKLEVNLFHRSPSRIKMIINALHAAGATEVYGLNGNARIPTLCHDRGICENDGIFSADIVLVPLEDGDRCIALKNMGKTVITIDLNPLSRTAQTADITIVDNIIRAIPRMHEWIMKLKQIDKTNLLTILNKWDNRQNLQKVREFMAKRLNSLV